MKGFNNLDLYFKNHLLKQQAIYLLKTSVLHYTVKLYSWDRFFIETYFDTNTARITKIKIAEAEDMEKHLVAISLCEIGYGQPDDSVRE